MRRACFLCFANLVPTLAIALQIQHWKKQRGRLVFTQCREVLFLDSPSSLNPQETEASGFPGGAVVESLPANAGDTGSSPGLGRSHMPQSNWAREPRLLSLRVWSLCSATREATIERGPRTAMKSGPRLPQLEKALTQKRRLNIAINQSINQSIFKKKKKKETEATPPHKGSHVFMPL